MNVVSSCDESNPATVDNQDAQISIDDVNTPSFVPSKVFREQKDYKLTAIICQISNGSQQSLVALIYVDSNYHKSKVSGYDTNAGQWYIFNDFSIAPISYEEVVWFTLDWKVPCVLFYSSVDSIDQPSRQTPIQHQLDNPFIHVSIFTQIKQKFFSLSLFGMSVRSNIFFSFLSIPTGHFQQTSMQK